MNKINTLKRKIEKLEKKFENSNEKAFLVRNRLLKRAGILEKRIKEVSNNG